MISIMGRRRAQKNKPIVELSEHMAYPPTASRGKKRVESSQISNWSQNVDCVGLRAHECMGFVGGEGLERYTL